VSENRLSFFLEHDDRLLLLMSLRSEKTRTDFGLFSQAMAMAKGNSD
jgi:hypothetical protein